MDFSNTALAANLQWLLEPFTYYLYSMGAFSVLVIVAIGTAIRMGMKQRAIVRDISSGIEAITKYRDPAQFSASFSDVHAALSENETLQRSWEEYEETLIAPLEDVDDPSYQVFRNTKRPSEFFISSQFLGRISPFFKPEDFIGFGLLLTFIGLVAALVEAGTGLGVNASDAAGMKSVILTLLSTAGGKFIASIGGVLGSLIVSMTQHRLSDRVQSKLSSFADALEERLIFASAEKIAADQYGHMKRQTANLERLSNEIAVAIGDKIESAMNRMPAMMGEAMEPVTEKLDSVAGQIGETSTEGMATMVSQLSEELKGAGQDSMQQVVSQLDTLGTTMGGTVESLRSTTEILKESLTGSARQAANDLSGSSEVFSQKITEAVEAMNQSQQGLHDTINGLVTQLQTGSEAFEEKMNSAREQTQQQLVTSLTAMNQHIARQASSASEEWQGQIRSTIAKGAEETAAELQNAAKKMSEQLQEPVAEVQSGLTAWVDQTKEVTSALQSINTQLGAHRDGIITSTSRLLEASGAMESASGAVRDTTIPMRDAATAAKTASDQLLTISKTTADRVANFSDQVGTSVTETRSILQKLQDTWQTQSKQLDNADEQLAGAFRSITTNLDASLGQLDKYNKDMDGNMARAVEGLSAMVEELSDAVESIPR
jgi:hypothetical protein